MKTFLRTCLTALLCSCTSSAPRISQTTNPADSYSATKVIPRQGGSFIVSAAGDTVIMPDSATYVPINDVAAPSWAPDPMQPARMEAVTGLTAHVTGRKCEYACFAINQVATMVPGGVGIVTMKVEFRDSKIIGRPVGKKYLPFSRTALDKAAQGTGLTVSFPEWNTRHTFSPAYVRGFLQRVDEQIRTGH